MPSSPYIIPWHYPQTDQYSVGIHDGIEAMCNGEHSAASEVSADGLLNDLISPGKVREDK